jgi:hypothetical protein
MGQDWHIIQDKVSTIGAGNACTDEMRRLFGPRNNANPVGMGNINCPGKLIPADMEQDPVIETNKCQLCVLICDKQATRYL